jgi:hypothetical protein
VYTDPALVIVSDRTPLDTDALLSDHRFGPGSPLASTPRTFHV